MNNASSRMRPRMKTLCSHVGISREQGRAKSIARGEIRVKSVQKQAQLMIVGYPKADGNGSSEQSDFRFGGVSALWIMQSGFGRSDVRRDHPGDAHEDESSPAFRRREQLKRGDAATCNRGARTGVLGWGRRPSGHGPFDGSSSSHRRGGSVRAGDPARERNRRVRRAAPRRRRSSWWRSGSA